MTKKLKDPFSDFGKASPREERDKISRQCDNSGGRYRRNQFRHVKKQAVSPVSFGENPNPVDVIVERFEADN